MIKKIILFLFFFLISVNILKAEDKNKIIIATAPYEPFYGSELKNDGYLAAIVREAFSRMDYSMDIIYMPWIRSLEKVKEGVYDGVLGAYYDKKREVDFYYSEPLDDVYVVLCGKKNLNITSYSSLENLKNYQIGIVRGYINEKNFDEADYLEKIPARSSEDNIKIFIKGRLDLIVDTKKIILHIIEKDYPSIKDDLVFLNPPLKTRHLHILFSKKIPRNKKIVKQFNQIIKDMRKNGTIEKIKKEYGF